MRLSKLLPWFAASTKLGLACGVQVVLESDGTEIDDDEVLSDFGREVLVILQHGERWESAGGYTILIPHGCVFTFKISKGFVLDYFNIESNYRYIHNHAPAFYRSR